MKIKRICISLIILGLLVLLVGCDPAGDDKIQDAGEGDAPLITVEFEDGTTEQLNIEEYVAGVVGAEMKPDWPVNAYAAQAIKARTFTLRFMEEEEENKISAEHEKAQAYDPDQITPEISEAVEQTRGLVATYNGEYIRAWFHSSAAGQTTSAQVGLAYDDAEPPYVVSVESPDHQAPDDIQNWQVMISQEEVLQALEEAGEEASQVSDINILDRDETGRIVELDIAHDQGTKRLKGAEFRTLVGPDNLKSTVVEEIRQEDDGFLFIGSGWGHGVGMSQWGAYHMGQEGSSAEEIIKYYFQDVEIEKKWD
ncbi:SpoIID/LytB domain-containing protein [Natroniella sp. ANB-PHB2]|uniref:SpoIID/LytB domain-containing protein n=1 Tax=Natroniella sp. ANB-PHB2 TaxID=3384444 RepID=UPI0038D35CF2